IGHIYNLQRQPEHALDYYQRSLALNEQVGNPDAIALSLNNIGVLYQRQEQWQDAIPLFLRAASLSERLGHGFELDVADELEGLAVCYVQLGEIKKGEAYYSRARRIREQLKPLPSLKPEALSLLRSLTGHTDDVDTVAFSPDGQTLASS